MVFKLKVDELSYLFIVMPGLYLNQTTLDKETQLTTLKNGAALKPLRIFLQPISE